MDDLLKRLRDWQTVYPCDDDKPEGHLYEEAADHIAALEARVAAADKLAELLNLPDQSDGLAGRYHYDWHKVDTALAAYEATKEQSK